MTDPMAATPGWVDGRLDEIFAGLPATAKPATDAFAECLARSKAPAAISDNLGAEFGPCHDALRRALTQLGVEPGVLAGVSRDLESLEAEIASES